jgi:hypothetical protein
MHNRYYVCHATYNVGGERRCIYVPGADLDRAVRDALLARLSPPRLEVIRAALERAIAGENAAERARESQMHKARERVTDLKYRYSKVDPANRLVAAELEKDLEQGIHDLLELEAREREREPSSLKDYQTVLDELLAINSDLPSLFDAATTDNHDRKLLVRTLVESVIIEDFNRVRVRARIVWVDGEPDTVVESPVGDVGRRTIWELACSGVDPAQIVEVLEEKGIRTTKGRPWLTAGVLRVIREVRKAQRQDGARRDGRWRRIGVPAESRTLTSADSSRDEL